MDGRKIISFVMSNWTYIVSITLFTIIFFPIIPNLVDQWSKDPDYSHGFVIPLIAAYFIWHKRAEFKNISFSTSGLGVLIVGIGACLFILAKLGYQFYLQYLSMVIILFGLATAHMGWEVAKRVAFSFFYLIFMIPLPLLVYRNITFNMRLFSTKLSFYFISLFGIQATIEGNIIHLPTTDLIVANPCSGLRGFIAYLVSSLAIGYLFQKKMSNRVVLVVFGIILAIVMNIIRLVALGLITNALKLKEIPGNIHDIEGIVVLIIGLAILFIFNDWLAKRGKKVA